MYMNYNQYNSYKIKVLDDLYNKKVPDVQEYLTNKFYPDDFLDLIKTMESEGLITNVQYVHGVEGHDHVLPSFEHAAITDEGIRIIEE